MATLAQHLFDLATRVGSEVKSVRDSLANYVTTSAFTTALSGKANTSNAILTGTPTAPTAAPGTSTTQIATTAYVEEGLTRATGGGGGNGEAWGPVTATGTGAAQNIALPEACSEGDVLVFVAGVHQPTTSYSINGTTLTTTQPNGLPISIVRYGIGQQGVAGLQSAITEINIDGGTPSTNYGGLTALNGGQP